MKTKKFYSIVLGLTDDEVEQLYKISGKLGISAPKLLETFTDIIIGEIPDEDGRAGSVRDWLEEMYACTKPSLLSYIQSLSGGDLREFIDCLLSLKQKHDAIEKIDIILQLLMENSIEDIDISHMSELKRICGKYGIEVDEKNEDVIKDCLKEEKETIHGEMYVADLGFEPGNLYSAVDVIMQTLDDFCRIYEVDNADIVEEMKKIIDWLEENQNCFQELEEPENRNADPPAWFGDTSEKNLEEEARLLEEFYEADLDEEDEEEEDCQDDEEDEEEEIPAGFWEWNLR